MGVEYRGVICVGYNYVEIQDIAARSGFEGDIEEFLEKHELQSFSPYYDAGHRDCIFGWEAHTTPDFDFIAIGAVLDSRLQCLVDNLSIRYGSRPEVYLMAQGW